MARLGGLDWVVVIHVPVVRSLQCVSAVSSDGIADTRVVTRLLYYMSCIDVVSKVTSARQATRPSTGGPRRVYLFFFSSVSELC